MPSNVRNATLVAATVGGALALAMPIAAQTRFDWPDTTVQVARYTAVEQCLAAAQRVRVGLERREALTVWRDTLPRDPQEALKPAPALVTETSTRCAARFAEPTADLRDFVSFLELYLAAGRDTDAAALVTRRLAAVPAKNKGERAAVTDSTIEILMAVRPARLEAAEKILLERAHDGTDRLDRIATYAKLMNAARSVGDTTRARRTAHWILAAGDSLTKTERESEKFERQLSEGAGVKSLLFNARRLLTGFPTMLDSLRHSTAALAALDRDMWHQATGERPEAMPLPAGERAPTITADHWFPSDAAGTPHPAPGRVTVVQFVDQQTCLYGSPDGRVGENCAGQLTALRRLGDRFPELQILVLAHTHGFFLYEPPSSVADEAEMIRKWIESYRIRGAVIAVTSTPFWNLPKPDARRIEKPTPNYTHFGFGRGMRPMSGEYVVDQSGIMVTPPTVAQDELVQVIDVLLHHQGGGPDHAAK
jgi:hypothetical protein